MYMEYQLGRGIQAKHDHSGIARHKPNDREHDDRRSEQYGDDQDDPMQEHSNHVSELSYSRMRP
jgi:hypothetical protein